MSDAAKCSQCSIEIDDPGDDWNSEADICINCLCSELQDQRDAARRERDELLRLVESHGVTDDGMTAQQVFDAMDACRDYNRKRKATT